MSSFKDKHLLLKLTIHRWNQQKYDRKATQDAEEANDTPGKLRTTKILLQNCLELKKVNALLSSVKMYHDSITAPWLDGGLRIIRGSCVMDYMVKLSERKRELHSVVNSLSDSWGSLVEQDQRSLHGLYDSSDYPSNNSLHDLYTFTVTVLPMPDENDFRLLNDVPEDIREKLVEEGKTQYKRQLSKSMEEVWKRLYTVVHKVGSTLSLQKGQPGYEFHKSLIENVKEQAELCRQLNLTDDLNMNLMINETLAKICEHDTKSLKESEELKLSVADQAKVISDKLKSYMVK